MSPTDQPTLVAWVVVLGDFGRSPRMQYHTLSLSQKPSTSVYVLAYPGSVPLQQLCSAPNVHLVTIHEPLSVIKRLPRILALLFKVLQQLLQLLWLMLVRLPRPQRILLQNPPAIPTLLICWLAARRHGAQLVVDWHNYGYTILGLTQGPRHWLVRLAQSHERFWGRKGDRHLCVTHAMKNDLRANWGINAVALHDRPPSFFRRTDLTTKHELFQRLDAALMDPESHDFLSDWQQARDQAGSALLNPTTLPAAEAAAGSAATGAGAAAVAAGAGPAAVAGAAAGAAAAGARAAIAAAAAAALSSETVISTVDVSGAVSDRFQRPAVVISSTSWTPDEDFGVLLAAAELYDRAATADRAGLPQVLFLITGKGPQKAMYLDRLRQMRFSLVSFRTLWLEAADYPLVLGAADVGVCLHASSSGLDLPMKVVDMFGSGLPVCALAYSCIHELVTDGQTGLLFSNAEELSQQLQQLLAGFPQRPSQLLQQLQRGVAEKQQSLRWDENWDRVAWPVLKP